MDPNQQPGGGQPAYGPATTQPPQYGPPGAQYAQLPPPKSSGRGKWIASLVVTILLLFGAIGFGVWAYLGRQDFKFNSDKKVAAAVDIAKQQESSAKDKEFIEKEKNPLTTYISSDTVGTIKLFYPKTWSVYMDESGSGNLPLSGLMHPKFVPGLQSKTAFALEVKVNNQNYANMMRQYESKSKSGLVTVTAFRLANVPDVLGSRVDGEINNSQQGAIVLLPLRDKTITISTQSQQYKGDFDNIILPNMTFVP